MIIRRTGPSSRRRRGVTIIETTVMMTGLAVMLGLCAAMLEFLMRIDADSRAKMEGAAALARLNERFREDVHLASSATPEAGAGDHGPRLRLTLEPDHRVEYEAAGVAKLVRIELRKGAVVHRESFHLPSRIPPRLEIREDDGLRFAVVGIDRRTPDVASNLPRPFEVVALVGKDRGPSAPSQAAGGGGSR
ncbi:hypothetical protein OJF2_56100 [Aquisphaera giovannonii]|uniref:Type II secretion system protein n=1 Tax=Aquisphaera giovannonii TaxID=406548 RepID=A0A5B9WAA4_9BACT|nr:hypothetical protein [Aquisphaera giovannonii]QEH37025.1 hypothetical protein OJF2_56100 [Aquisphaera giovannonii]